MTLPDQIAREVASLPRDVQAQVLDFVEYLVRKYAADAPTEDEAWDQAAPSGARGENPSKEGR